MARINLPRVDAVPIEYAELHNIMERWFTDLVDQLNTALDEIDSSLYIGETADVGGMGAVIVISCPGMTAQYPSVAIVKSSTVAQTVVSCVSGIDQITVTLTGDPGASCFINYTALIATK